MVVYVLDASAGWELLSDSELGRAIEAELEVDGELELLFKKLRRNRIVDNVCREESAYHPE